MNNSPVFKVTDEIFIKLEGKKKETEKREYLVDSVIHYLRNVAMTLVNICTKGLFGMICFNIY